MNQLFRREKERQCVKIGQTLHTCQQQKTSLKANALLYSILCSMFFVSFVIAYRR